MGLGGRSHLARKEDRMPRRRRIDRAAEAAEPRAAALVLAGVVEGDREREERLVRVRGQRGLRRESKGLQKEVAQGVVEGDSSKRWW